MLEKTLSVQITVRIIYLNSTIETIFLEITGKIDILGLLGFILELVHMLFDFASESPVYGALGIDTDIETCSAPRISFLEKFMDSQLIGSNAPSQIGGYVPCLVSPEYQICL